MAFLHELRCIVPEGGRSLRTTRPSRARVSRVVSQSINGNMASPVTRSPSLKIAVVGAGIGGLTAPLPLRQAGFDGDVYEQAPELTEVGGGINMGPNAARIPYRPPPARAPHPGAPRLPRAPPARAPVM